MTRQRAIRLGIFALAVVGALAGAGVAWIHLTTDPLADAHAYFDAADRLNHGLPLYPPGIDPSSNLVYLYPPLLAVALRPFALLPYPVFALVWEAIVLVSFGLLIVQLGTNRRIWLAIGILGIPIGWALSIAQAHVPMTLLLAIGQPWSVALAANVKIFPALVALWWLGRRDYQAFIAFLLWMLLWGLAQLVLEPGGTIEFLGGGVGLAQLGAVRNISPFAFGSPILWAALVILVGLLTLRLARTRWGWAAAIALGTLSPPRLLVYMLTGLLAALREPQPPGAPDPDAPVDASTAYLRSFR
jgi:hypothetical protein